MSASPLPLAGAGALAGAVRAYVPSTLALVRAMGATGTIGPGPVLACAVTPWLREDHPDGDVEELEYAAMRAAARGSLRLLAADESAPRRRVVLAVDVPAVQVRTVAELDRTAVLLESTVPLADLVSVHVDDADAQDAVRSAVLALGTAEGDAKAVALPDDALDALEDHELLWYAAQELPDLLDPRGSMNG